MRTRWVPSSTFGSRPLSVADTDWARFIPSRNQLNFFTAANEDPSDQIFVFFTDERSVGVKTMRKYANLEFGEPSDSRIHPTRRLLSILEEKSIKRGIIIFPGNMTPSARKVSRLRRVTRLSNLGHCTKTGYCGNVKPVPIGGVFRG